MGKARFILFCLQKDVILAILFLSLFPSLSISASLSLLMSPAHCEPGKGRERADQGMGRRGKDMRGEVLGANSRVRNARYSISQQSPAWKRREKGFEVPKKFHSPGEARTHNPGIAQSVFVLSISTVR